MPMIPQISALLERRLAAPKQWRVTTVYDNGTEKHHDTETEAQARNWSAGECDKLGRALIDRTTGKVVCVVAVSIDAI